MLYLKLCYVYAGHLITLYVRIIQKEDIPAQHGQNGKIEHYLNHLKSFPENNPPSCYLTQQTHISG